MADVTVEENSVIEPATAPRRRRRALRGAAAGLVTAWAGTGVYLFTIGAGSAGASTQPVFKVTPNGPDASQTYLPIPGQNPVLATVGDPTPDECGGPGYCDLVPFEVTTPADFNTDQYYLTTQIAVSWDSQRVDNPAQPVQQDDMDIFLYAADKDKAGNWVELGKSASSSNPEKVSTEQTKFLVLVNNFSGPNTGYKVTAHSTIEKIEKPTEAVLPTVHTGSGGGSTDLAPTASLPLGGGVTSSADTGASTAAPTPSPFVPVAPTSTGTVQSIDLVRPGQGGADVSFSNDISGALRGGRQVASNAAATSKAPSSLLLILWLGVVPVALVGGGGVWLARRSPVAIKVA